MAPTRTEQRDRLVAEAIRVLDDDGPHALQARHLTSRVGTSTQAVYTLFGGMPGLVDAVAEQGFVLLARRVDEIGTTDDTVADHFVRGMAYCGWAAGHAPLYRLMFGVTGTGGSSARSGLLSASAGTTAPEARRALDVLERSVQHMVDAGRIVTDVDTATVARQFLSTTHGYVLLDLGGVFGDRDDGLATLASLALTLMVGLGDDRASAERSLVAALARFTAGPDGS